MTILQCQNVCFSNGTATILQNVAFTIQKGDRIGLIGRNGKGKSTLLQILSGQIALTTGQVARVLPTTDWCFIRQDFEFSNLRVSDYLESITPNYLNAKRAVDFANRQLQANVDSAEALAAFTEAYDHFLAIDGYGIEQKLEQALATLGLTKAHWQMPIAALSGGEKTRLQLTQLLIAPTSFILLDEPTNHLDDEGIDWLIKWLQSYKGTFLVVSHDRYFLDQVATSIIELKSDGTKRYPGNYQAYHAQKQIEEQTAKSLYQKQRKQEKKVQEQIKKIRMFYEKANQAASVRDPFAQHQAAKTAARYKAKASSLEKLTAESIAKPEEKKLIHAALSATSFKPRTYIHIEDAAYSYNGQESIWEHLTLDIIRDDRIALIGKNGSGKSTLLSVLTGSLTASGIVQHNPSVRIGYFAQTVATLNPEATVLDAVMALPNMTYTEARTILASFLFIKDEVLKRIEVLSMGEKCRVAFVLLYFSDANLLILDEPTNYLDIDSRVQIEAALASFDGALVIVSHDRYFLKNVANKVLQIKDRQFHVVNNYFD